MKFVSDIAGDLRAVRCGLYGIDHRCALHYDFGVLSVFENFGSKAECHNLLAYAYTDRGVVMWVLRVIMVNYILIFYRNFSFRISWKWEMQIAVFHRHLPGRYQHGDSGTRCDGEVLE